MLQSTDESRIDELGGGGDWRKMLSGNPLLRSTVPLIHFCTRKFCTGFGNSVDVNRLSPLVCGIHFTFSEISLYREDRLTKTSGTRTH